MLIYSLESKPMVSSANFLSLLRHRDLLNQRSQTMLSPLCLWPTVLWNLTEYLETKRFHIKPWKVGRLGNMRLAFLEGHDQWKLIGCYLHVWQLNACHTHVYKVWCTEVTNLLLQTNGSNNLEWGDEHIWKVNWELLIWKKNVNLWKESEYLDEPIEFSKSNNSTVSPCRILK